MNVFDVLREKLKERKKSEIDLSNKHMDIDRKISTAYANKALAIGEVIEIVNQVEQFCKEILKLNIDDKKPSVEELAKHLQMHMDLFTFNPSNGETLEPWQMNELNRDLYTTMYYAKQFLKSEPKTNGDRIRAMSDERLADALLKINEISDHIPFCGNKKECDDIMDQGELIPESMCKQCLMNWLKKEVNT